MSSKVIITDTKNTVTITPTGNTNVDTNIVNTPVTVTQGSTSVVTVNTPGPMSGLTNDLKARHITSSGNISSSGFISASSLSLTSLGSDTREGSGPASYRSVTNVISVQNSTGVVEDGTTSKLLELKENGDFWLVPRGYNGTYTNANLFISSSGGYVSFGNGTYKIAVIRGEGYKSTLTFGNPDGYITAGRDLVLSSNNYGFMGFGHGHYNNGLLFSPAGDTYAKWDAAGIHYTDPYYVFKAVMDIKKGRFGLGAMHNGSHADRAPMQPAAKLHIKEYNVDFVKVELDSSDQLTSHSIFEIDKNANVRISGSLETTGSFTVLNQATSSQFLKVEYNQDDKYRTRLTIDGPRVGTWEGGGEILLKRSVTNPGDAGTLLLSGFGSTGNNTPHIEASNTAIVFGNALVPNANIAYNLGDISRRWETVYINNLNASGIVSSSEVRIDNSSYDGHLKIEQHGNDKYRLVSNIGNVFEIGAANVIKTPQRIEGTRGMFVKTYLGSDPIRFRDYDDNNIILVDHSGSLTLGNASAHEPSIIINTDVTASGTITSTTGNITSENNGLAAVLRANRTDGKIGALWAGSAGVGYGFDQTGYFFIEPATREVLENNNFASGTNTFYMKGSNGYIGLGTSTPTERLTVVGNISASGNIITNDVTISSDGNVNGASARLKLQGLGNEDNLQESTIQLDANGGSGGQAIIFNNAGGKQFRMHGSSGFYSTNYYMVGNQGVKFQQNYRAADDDNGDTAFTFNNGYAQPTGYLFTISHQNDPHFRIGNSTGSIELLKPVTASGDISASGKITANGVAFDFPNGYTLSSSQFASIDQLEHSNNFALKAHGNLALHGTNATIIKYGADNGANGWVVNSSGHFKPYSLDNTFDIGSTTVRPRKIYTRDLDVSGSLIASGGAEIIGTTKITGDWSIGPQGNAGPITGYTLSIRDTSPNIALKNQTNDFGIGGIEFDATTTVSNLILNPTTGSANANTPPTVTIKLEDQEAAKFTTSSLILDYDKMPTADPGIKGAIYRDGSNQLFISPG